MLSSLAILFIIDPPDRLDPPTDTSLAIMRESLRRGYKVFVSFLPDLRLENGRPAVRARPVDFPSGEELFTAGDVHEIDLSRFAVVYMRKDPPVDTGYLHATYILDRFPPNILQVNPSRALRSHCEKLIPGDFPGMQPESLVSACGTDLAEFLHRERKIVVKPLDDCSGRGILILEKSDPEAARKIDQAVSNGRFVQAQRFLPEIEQGDKRVLLLGGEILGWVRRVPPPGDFRSNVNAGGRCVPCELTPHDRAICERLRPWLQREEIHLAGVDIVGEHVLEVNITSPSCLREINELTGAALECAIVDYVQERMRSPGTA
jgi:glutathione synthase